VRKYAFNNAKMTRLLSKYARHPKDMRLRDKILRLSMPLVDMAISKKQYFTNRADLRQDCAVKILQGLDKFSPERGSAFAFLWTVICNTLITKNQQLQSHGYSMNSDEDTQREAESVSSVLDTPETKYILRNLALSLSKVVNTNGFSDMPNRKRVVRYLLSSISSGDLFQDRSVVFDRLKKRYGLSRKDAEFYVNHTLVVVRAKLLAARENVLQRESVHKTWPTLSQESGL